MYVEPTERKRLTIQQNEHEHGQFWVDKKMANRTKASEQLAEFSQDKKVGVWLRMTGSFPHELAVCLSAELVH